MTKATLYVAGNAKQVNQNIPDLVSVRLAREPWNYQKAILADPSLTAGVKVAALAILSFINRSTGLCFASYATIAKAAAMTERGIRASVVKLEAAGYVRVTRRGARRTNLIHLALPAAETTGDRHHGAAMTVTTVPANFRDELLSLSKEERNKTTSSESVAGTHWKQSFLKERTENQNLAVRLRPAIKEVRDLPPFSPDFVPPPLGGSISGGLRSPWPPRRFSPQESALLRGHSR